MCTLLTKMIKISDYVEQTASEVFETFKQDYRGFPIYATGYTTILAERLLAQGNIKAKELECDISLEAPEIHHIDSEYIWFEMYTMFRRFPSPMIQELFMYRNKLKGTRGNYVFIIGKDGGVIHCMPSTKNKLTC
jgi:hypothetical protein